MHPSDAGISRAGCHRSNGHFADREALVWAAEQSHLEPHPAIPVLLVSPVEKDHRLLRRILKPPAYLLASAHSIDEFVAVRRRRRPAVVISDCQCECWCWQDVWRVLRKLPKTPRLIVCANRTDEQLWAEIVAAGGEDLIARPFNPDEVVWAVEDAWSNWDRSQWIPPVFTAASGAGA